MSRASARRRSLDRNLAHSGLVTAPAFLTRKIPAYELLDEEALVRLEDHAEWLLSEVGIEIRDDPEALELFRKAGATIDGELLRFDPGHVRTLCQTAPGTYTMHARNPARNIEFGGNNLVFGSAYGSPFVTDLKAGRRYATLEDFQNFIKLSYLSPWLHHQSGTICEPVDIAVNKRHLDMVYAHLRYSDKPFMGSVTAPERAQDTVAVDPPDVFDARLGGRLMVSDHGQGLQRGVGQVLRAGAGQQFVDPVDKEGRVLGAADRLPSDLDVNRTGVGEERAVEHAGVVTPTDAHRDPAAVGQRKFHGHLLGDDCLRVGRCRTVCGVGDLAVDENLDHSWRNLTLHTSFNPDLPW